MKNSHKSIPGFQKPNTNRHYFDFRWIVICLVLLNTTTPSIYCLQSEKQIYSVGTEETAYVDHIGPCKTCKQAFSFKSLSAKSPEIFHLEFSNAPVKLAFAAPHKKDRFGLSSTLSAAAIGAGIGTVVSSILNPDYKICISNCQSEGEIGFQLGAPVGFLTSALVSLITNAESRYNPHKSRIRLKPQMDNNSFGVKLVWNL